MTTMTSKWLTGNSGPVTEEVTAVDPLSPASPLGLDGRHPERPNPGEVAPPLTTGSSATDGPRGPPPGRPGRWYRNRWCPPTRGSGPTNVIGQAGPWAIVEWARPRRATDGWTRWVEGRRGAGRGHNCHPKLDPTTGGAPRRQLPLGPEPCATVMGAGFGRVRRRRVPVDGGPMVHDCVPNRGPLDPPVTSDMAAAMAVTRSPRLNQQRPVGLLSRARPTMSGGTRGRLPTCSTPNAWTRPAGSCSTWSAIRRCSHRRGPADGPPARPLTIDPTAGRVAESTVGHLRELGPAASVDRTATATPWSSVVPEHPAAGEVRRGHGHRRAPPVRRGRVTDEIFVPRSPDAGETRLVPVVRLHHGRHQRPIVAADDHR
jgi:hypothetical protein